MAPHSWDKIINNIRNIILSDKYSVIRSIAIVTSMTIILMIVEIAYPPASTLKTILSATIASLTVTFIFGILDRIRMLSPVEEAISESLSIISKELNDAARALGDNKNYQNAVDDFGFVRFAGISTRDEHGNMRDRYQARNLIISVLNEAPARSDIDFMTTFISESDRFSEAVTSACLRGARIRLLMMMPCPEIPVMEARALDFYESNYFDKVEGPKLLCATVRPHAEAILRLRDRIRSTAQGGSIEVLFYTKSLNMPMIIVRPDRSMKIEKYAYTGFYARGSAETMPYIMWRGGRFGIVQRFEDVFNAKWHKCREAGLSEINCSGV